MPVELGGADAGLGVPKIAEPFGDIIDIETSGGCVLAVGRIGPPVVRQPGAALDRRGGRLREGESFSVRRSFMGMGMGRFGLGSI